MIDAAANDAMDALEACPCCLLGPQQRCLNTPYTHLDNTEIYSDMLSECFNIQLDVASDKCGICEECMLRLRDASHFKRQVQRSQSLLFERLARALEIIEEAPPVTVKSETADEDGKKKNNLSEEAPPVTVKSETADEDDNLSGEELADEKAGSGGAGAALRDESDVIWEAADDATSDDSTASLKQSELKRTCSVSLDQMFVDTEHRTCRVGSQTYKLSLYSRPTPGGNENNFGKSMRSNLKHAEMETAGEQEASVTRQVYPVTNADDGEMPGVQHSKTASITKETTHNCKYCSYASANKCHLVVHERIHSGEKPYKCNRCSYASTNKSNLLVHEGKHTGEKPYKCNRCSYASSYKSLLLVHERKHTGETPYKCSHCSYASSSKSHLVSHERIHSGEKPYKCSHCGYASANKCNLLVHERKHTGETPYKCSHCSYASSSKSHLVSHERIHSGEKPYECSHCSFASAFKSSLLAHETIHTGEKPSYYGQCSYTSSSSSAHKRESESNTLYSSKPSCKNFRIGSYIERTEQLIDRMINSNKN